MALPVFLALLPVAILIALGYAIRRSGFLAEGFWPQAEKLGYFVLLPSLFLHGLATVRLGDIPILSLALVLVVSTLAVAATLVALRPLLPVDGPGFTSIFQGGVRFNNYVGVTIAAGLFGAQGIALAAVCNAAIVPTVNILCVLVFARFGATRLSFAGLVRQILANPLVLACAGGILLQALGAGLPPGIEPALKALGQASLPLGLICVGAALDFGTARRWVQPMLAASSAKFLLMPAATAIASITFGLGGVAASVALLFQALPTASSAYIMARQLGGDAPLMAGITATQTILAALAIPLAMAGAAYLTP